MTPTLTRTERQSALVRISGILDRQQQKAERAGADMLAARIQGAIAEANVELTKG